MSKLSIKIMPHLFMILVVGCNCAHSGPTSSVTTEDVAGVALQTGLSLISRSNKQPITSGSTVLDRHDVFSVYGASLLYLEKSRCDLINTTSTFPNSQALHMLQFLTLPNITTTEAMRIKSTCFDSSVAPQFVIATAFLVSEIEGGNLDSTSSIISYITRHNKSLNSYVNSPAFIESADRLLQNRKKYPTARMWLLSGQDMSPFPSKPAHYIHRGFFDPKLLQAVDKIKVNGWNWPIKVD